MELIEFNRDDFTNDIDKLSSKNKEALLNIFSDEEFKEYIENNDFDKAYDYFDRGTEFFNYRLTSILLLSDINILRYLSKIPDECFHSLPILNITIPANITKIGNDAFSSIKTLNTIYIPKTVKSIDWFAFSNSNIKEINFEVSEEEAYNIFNGRVSVYRFRYYLGIDRSVKLNFNVKRD